jgi:hypothetical protein
VVALRQELGLGLHARVHCDVSMTLRADLQGCDAAFANARRPREHSLKAPPQADVRPLGLCLPLRRSSWPQAESAIATERAP